MQLKDKHHEQTQDYRRCGVNNNIKSIERRFKRILKDCEKADLILVAVGDGNNLLAYKREDYEDGELDQISGITDSSGETIEPIIELYSRAIH